ncbi:helix-turn-helix transcriptional regulator [Nitrospira sp. CMX1]
MLYAMAYNDIVRLKKLCERYPVSPRTLERWITRGLPVLQAGHRMTRYVRLDDVEKFLTARPNKKS